MRPLEILSEQMQVFLRGADLGVTEDYGQPNDLATVPQVLSWEGVTQPMGA